MVLDGYADVHASNSRGVYIQRALLFAIAPGEGRARPPSRFERPGNKLDVVNLKIVSKAIQACRVLMPIVEVGLEKSLDESCVADRLSHGRLV